jgi:hypothetical protein
MNKKTAFLTFFLVAIVAVGATVVVKRSSAKKSVLKPFEALGTVAAQETAKLVGGQGALLLVVPDFSGMANPGFDAQLAAFKKEIQKNSGLSIASVETIQVGVPDTGGKPKTLKFMEPTAAGRPPVGPQPGQLGQLMANYPQTKAVVYFVDLPEFNSADVAAVRQQGTKLVAVSDWRPNYKALFQGNLLQLSVVPRWEPYPEPGKKPKNMQDWFDRSYALVTVDNVASVP